MAARRRERFRFSEGHESMPDPGTGNDVGARDGRGRRVVVALLVVLAGAAALAYALTRRPAPASQATTRTTTASSTQPATGPATQGAAKPPPKPRGPTTQYLDAVYANYPRMPQTRPMDYPLDLPQAARLVFQEPVYLSPRQDLWITRPDGPPTESVLARAAREQGDQLALVVRDVVAFVHWMPRETGPWTFNLIARKPDGTFELVTPTGRRPVGTPGRVYHWERALDWNDKVIVATDNGVSVFQFEPEVSEQHHDLAPASGTLAEPQVLLDWQGFLAWIPWERGKTGSRGAARYVEGRWDPLGPEQGWPEKLLHLVPLYDGSVLQIIAKDGDQVGVALASLEKRNVDEKQVVKQVEALSDPDENVRQNAYKELTLYGPSLAPVLERILKDQEPEAQARLRQLIKSQVEPTLGGMTLLGDQLRIAARLADGGAVFYAEAGVMMPGDGDTPVFRTPAWLSLRPGQAVQLLDPPLTTDLNPDRSRIYAFNAEWIVANDARGPQWFVGNYLVPLLRKNELAQGFVEPIGIDRRGRWLFRPAARAEARAAGPATPLRAAPVQVAAPQGPQAVATRPATSAPAGPAASNPASDGPALAPTTRAAGAGVGGGQSLPTLVIDPTLPDPTPRLPVWLYTTATTVGWDKDDWPVVKNNGAWALAEQRFRPLRSKEKMFTKPEEVPEVAPVTAATAPPTGAAPVDSIPAGSTDAKPAPGNAGATVPASAPATGPADDLGPPLAISRDGTRYHDGRTHLRVVAPNGKRTDWPLPPAATGTGVGGKVYLVRARDGNLFLFNQPGRVVRIRPTPEGDEPYTVDATFTRKIPAADAFTRVWLDPAGRIVVAHDNRLAILFPGGFIPPSIVNLIGDADLDEP
jgi:hypothetical protein